MHKNHYGFNQTTTNLKDKIWWPYLRAQVKDMFDNCVICLDNHDNQPEKEEVEKTNIHMKHQ